MSGGGVGRSWRTHGKHTLMRSLLGKEVGVLNAWSRSVRTDVGKVVWYDLTAGDGVAPDDESWVQGCSPGILADHASRLERPGLVLLHEIQPATYDRLLSSLAANLPRLGYNPVGPTGAWCRGPVQIVAINGNGAEADTTPVQWGDAVFVLNDPNAITEWAMRPTFTQELIGRTWLCRSLSTMGCNPAGIKRLDRAEREQWFELVRQQQDTLPAHRDLLLAAIERDSAQWAYLVGDAAKWRASTENVVRTAFAKVGRTVAASWFRSDSARFEETKRELFLTRSELRGEEVGLF